MGLLEAGVVGGLGQGMMKMGEYINQNNLQQQRDFMQQMMQERAEQRRAELGRDQVDYAANVAREGKAIDKEDAAASSAEVEAAFAEKYPDASKMSASAVARAKAEIALTIGEKDVAEGHMKLADSTDTGAYKRGLLDTSGGRRGSSKEPADIIKWKEWAKSLSPDRLEALKDAGYDTSYDSFMRMVSDRMRMSDKMKALLNIEKDIFIPESKKQELRNKIEGGPETKKSSGNEYIMDASGNLVLKK